MPARVTSKIFCEIFEILATVWEVGRGALSPHPRQFGGMVAGLLYGGPSHTRLHTALRVWILPLGIVVWMAVSRCVARTAQRFHTQKVMGVWVVQMDRRAYTTTDTR